MTRMSNVVGSKHMQNLCVEDAAIAHIPALIQTLRAVQIPALTQNLAPVVTKPTLFINNSHSLDTLLPTLYNRNPHRPWHHAHTIPFPTQ